MKNYIVETIKKKFHVKETKTDFIMAIFTERKKADDLCLNLNKRGGFEGESPPFFACKLPSHK